MTDRAKNIGVVIFTLVACAFILWVGRPAEGEALLRSVL